MGTDGSVLGLSAKRVDPRGTRFLVIDVQSDFCAEGGSFDKHGNDLCLIHAAVDQLAGFIDVSRKAGVSANFISDIYDKLCQGGARRHFRGVLDASAYE
jgi:nicotinamidase-related amidase